MAVKMLPVTWSIAGLCRIGQKRGEAMEVEIPYAYCMYCGAKTIIDDAERCL